MLLSSTFRPSLLMGIHADQHVKEQLQQKRPQNSSLFSPSLLTSEVIAGAAGLSKALQQAKGNSRAPAVVAAALGALRMPQGGMLGSGVLLLNLLDSVQLVSSLQNLTR